MTIDVTGLRAEPKKKHKGVIPGYRYYNAKDELIAKTCGGCKAVLDIEMFSRATSTRDRHAMFCKTCNGRTSRLAAERQVAKDPQFWSRKGRDRAERYLSRSDEEIAAAQYEMHPRGLKSCPQCGTEKPLDQFNRHGRCADGLRRKCRTCDNSNRSAKLKKRYESYWISLGIPFSCYLCGGSYDDVEHLIPTTHPRGRDTPDNTRPSCIRCNRGKGVGKWNKPLEHYIFSVNHPTKTRAQILYEIVMSGTWPFALTTPEEFVEQCKTLEEAECISK